MTRHLLLLATFALPLDALAQDSSLRNSIHLDGVDDYVSVQDADNLDLTGDFTVEVMFRSISDSPTQFILTKRNFQIPDTGYQLSLQGGTVFMELFAVGMPFNDGLLLREPHPFDGTQTSYNDGAWHHAAIVRTGSTVNLYVDGREGTELRQWVSQEGLETSMANPASLAIGVDPPPVVRFGFGGEIDEFRIWQRSRSLDEVRSSMERPLDLRSESDTTDLALYFRFDEIEDLGVGNPGRNDVRDLSRFQTHGDLVGGATLLEAGEAFRAPRLTLLFESMNPHVGQKFELRVLDQGTGKEVARYLLPEIEEPNFEVWLNALLKGHSYRIDFYADFSQNGSYDAPPVDHAWRLTLEAAEGNDTLRFVHNTDFTDTGWPASVAVAIYEAVWEGIVAELNTNTELPLTAHVKLNLESAQAEAMLEIADLVSIAVASALTFKGDTLVLEPDEVAGKTTALEGSLVLSNLGQVSGELTYESAENSVDISLEGTLGRTQTLMNFDSDFLGATGVLWAEETEVIRFSGVASENPGEISSSATTLALTNHPNPFGMRTRFNYVLPSDGVVTIHVFDILGREVRTTHPSLRPRGNQSLSFDAQGLSAGVYLARLTALLIDGRMAEDIRTFSIAR